MFTSYITQTYVQSDTELERVFYIRAPEEMDLKHRTVTRVVRPLYGIPESSLHWSFKYQIHHTERLGMIRSKADPCVLIERNNWRLKGMNILQVDDTMEIGTQGFFHKEK